MDPFIKFNKKSVNDRQIDTLIGLSKGLLADGKVVQSEAEFLLKWLVQSRQASDNPIIINLLERVDSMLQDGLLDADESGELLDLLQKITGDKSELGELAKTCSLPLDNPVPSITFPDKKFVLSGTFAYGKRSECQSVIESLGGNNSKNITKSVNYLVLGMYVTDSWIHESFGRKIEKAIEYRDNGVPLVIVNEEHWAQEAGVL